MEKRKKKDEFSATEVGALIETIRSEIKPVLEAIPDMRKKLDSIFEQVGENTEKIVLLETAVQGYSERITRVETKTDRVLEELKSKVDRKDFEILKNKVASLTA